MNKPDTEEEATASVLYRMTPAAFTVRRSDLVSHGSNIMPCEASAADLSTAWHNWKTGIVKMPHHIVPARSEISGPAPTYWHFQIMMKFHMQGAQKFRPIFTEGVQVAAGRRVMEWDYIYSALRMKTEFYLLDGAYLELTTTDGRTTTGSRAAGIVNAALNVASFASKYWVVFHLLGLASNGRVPHVRCTAFVADTFQEDARRQKE